MKTHDLKRAFGGRVGKIMLPASMHMCFYKPWRKIQSISIDDIREIAGRNRHPAEIINPIILCNQPCVHYDPIRQDQIYILYKIPHKLPSILIL